MEGTGAFTGDGAQRGVAFAVPRSSCRSRRAGQRAQAQQIGPAAACWLAGGRGGVHPVGLSGQDQLVVTPGGSWLLAYCTGVIVHGRAHLVGSLFA
jgi:hypothetical protein